MDTPVRPDQADKSLYIGGIQLCQTAVFEDALDNLMIAAQALKHVCVCGITCFGFGQRRQAELVEQDIAQLFCGVDVEGFAGMKIYCFSQLLNPFPKLAAKV